MGRLDEVRAAVSRSGNTRLDRVIDVLIIISDYFKDIYEKDRYENFYDYHASSNPQISREEKTEYYKGKLDYDTRSIYRRIRQGGYRIGNED